MDQEFFYQSPIGILKVQLRRDKVYSIAKVRKNKKDFCATANSFSFPARAGGESKTMGVALSFLDDYFQGKAVKNNVLSFFPRGTAFQKKVWRYLQKIPYGQTHTYSSVAKALGTAGAARAVGSACAKNPYLILVPCHRVVAQKGLGGFALGLRVKQRLLNHEASLYEIF